MIDESQKQRDEYASVIFSKFEKQFNRIFKYITVDGSSEARMKKIAEKKGGQTKYKNAINIFVTFNSNIDPIRKWSQFSGGQKTVIALSMLMALQKCEPAPFYVFD